MPDPDTNDRPNAAEPSARERRGTLRPPPGGAVVRMYRIGHGDCFLLAFDGEDDTVFVLIDCGYKPGSSQPLGTSPNEIVEDIRRATGGRIDVAVITHEHQDHVNAITEPRFAGIEIEQTWLAWTESESDEVAKRLRARHRDHLQALVQAQGRLAALPSGRSMAAILSLEIGGEEESNDVTLNAFGAGGTWTNKHAMALFRRRARLGTRFLYPHQDIVPLPGAPAVRVFPLGPPRDEKLLRSLDPVGAENFGDKPHRHGSAFDFFAAALAGDGTRASHPFEQRFTLPIDQLATKGDLATWYRTHYGPIAGEPPPAPLASRPMTGKADRLASRPSQLDVLPDDDESRRIETEWLLSAEALALKMGNDTNNGSLVLAFELGRGGKVLLFAGDAQRGNWVSWATQDFEEGGARIAVRDLLGRTVLYKVGHHGSHNATLKGEATDSHPNLAWLGRGRHANEFTAMVPAVRSWALDQDPPWNHPLPAIREALQEKCGGRVLQTDTDPDLSTPPAGIGKVAWNDFGRRVRVERLYFDYTVSP